MIATPTSSSTKAATDHSNIPRGTIKTYARRPQRDFLIHDGDFPRKRVRMDDDGTALEEYLNVPAEDPSTIAAEDRVPSSSTVPSSPAPADDRLFSDPVPVSAHGTESPPSSPPPRLASPESTTEKPAFSFLKRKRSLRSHDVSESTPEALNDIAPNIQPNPPPAKRTHLTQMQIDLGGEVQRTCKACGMEYIPSNKEDSALHKEYHAMNLAGIDVGKQFLSKKDGGLKRAYPREKRWLNEGEEMVMVDRKSPLWARNQVKKVLEIANAELGSADIKDEELWAALAPSSDRPIQAKGKKDIEVSDKAGERFKAFLHLKGEKCIGFCLAEKISSANRVIDPKVDDEQPVEEAPSVRSSSISVSTDVDVVLLGIARIWTSKSHRNRGIATDLLETARGNFFYGVEVPKELVAFSQPTESGGKFAEWWFGFAMAGMNPFRRKDTPPTSQSQPNTPNAGADPVARAGIRFPPIDTGVPKSTKTKTVRILSPHYSRSKDGHGGPSITSPPPQDFSGSPAAGADSPSSVEEPSPTDPFSAQSDEGTSQDDDEDLRRNTLANAASLVSQTPLNMQIPPNHSKKAPAPQIGGDASSSGSREEPGRAPSALDTGRPHYDVDDFKRLLLTGEKLRADKTTPTTPTAQGQGLQMGDSNSNTDASSVSRQSIFEPHPEVHPESPRTSMDVSPSDDERHGLVQPSLSPNVGRSRPSVPLSRHGKLVKQHMPQTVSFESLSSSPPGPDSTSVTSSKPSSPASLTDTTNLNKPLPPPPRSESPTPMESMPAISAAVPAATAESVAPSNHLGRVTAKRSPPAIPTARRHGQGRSRSSTNESSRSASLSQELSQYIHLSSSPTSSCITAPKPPPIPPPRRAGTAPTQENSSPVSSVKPSFSNMEPPFKPRPPAPPSRTPSTTSIKRASRISTASGSSGPVPPPPPAPRRRGSSQSQTSFTPSRLSGEYRISGNERTKGDLGTSSTQQPSASETQIEGKDLVADLTALQKEVDELRGRFGR
ncbi:MAG: hypothetical protein Q9166_000773 [cf. Caloplaca sp. 2 TL-2023]